MCRDGLFIDGIVDRLYGQASEYRRLGCGEK